jgi:hypothetical protein
MNNENKVTNSYEKNTEMSIQRQEVLNNDRYSRVIYPSDPAEDNICDSCQ